MSKKINRRALIAGAVASAAAAIPAKASPTKGKPIEPGSSLEATFHAMEHMLEHPENIAVCEVQAADLAPHYRKGDLVIVQEAQGKPSDHVYVRRKGNVPPMFGELVATSSRGVFIRGFRRGDRMRFVPDASIASWGRIAFTYRP